VIVGHNLPAYDVPCVIGDDRAVSTAGDARSLQLEEGRFVLREEPGDLGMRKAPDLLFEPENTRVNGNY